MDIWKQLNRPWLKQMNFPNWKLRLIRIQRGIRNTMFLQRLRNLIDEVIENGVLLTTLTYVRKVIRSFYNRIVLGNSLFDLDYTAKVEGLRNIELYGSVSAGRYFWLATYERYGEQRMQPKIIFKGKFSASDFCHIGATNYIEFGDNVLLGSKVYITDHQHGSYSGAEQSSPLEPPGERKLTTDKSVVIGDNVWIGDNVVILPGVTIGSGCVIGANAVVTDNVASNSVVVGIPAKVIREYDEKEKLWRKIEEKINDTI